MSIIMIYLGDAESEQNSNILKMLNKLFSEEVGAIEKVQFLSDEYRISATENLEKGVQEMCNLSQGIKEKGRAEGKVEGIEQGLMTAVINIMNNLKLSIEEAMAVAGVPASEHERYATSIRKLAK